MKHSRKADLHILKASLWSGLNYVVSAACAVYFPWVFQPCQFVPVALVPVGLAALPVPADCVFHSSFLGCVVVITVTFSMVMTIFEHHEGAVHSCLGLETGTRFWWFPQPRVGYPWLYSVTAPLDRTQWHLSGLSVAIRLFLRSLLQLQTWPNHHVVFLIS